MTDKKRFLNEVKEVRLIIQANRAQGAFSEGYLIGQESVLEHFEKFIDSLQEEPVSEDLEEAAKRYGTEGDEISGLYIIEEEVEAFKAGAKWQKIHLWKPADGDDLPEIDREVIALLDNGKVVFAYRPPEYWDGKDIVTGKVTRNYPKTYDKGGWNIPDVKWWLDVKLPKEIEL